MKGWDRVQFLCIELFRTAKGGGCYTIPDLSILAEKMKQQQGCFKRRMCSTADSLPLLSKENPLYTRAIQTLLWQLFQLLLLLLEFWKNGDEKKESELPRNTKVFENMKAIFMWDLLGSKAIFLGLIEILKGLFLWNILKINSKGFIHAGTKTV